MVKYGLDVPRFANALCEAGILHKEDLNNISRIVIDIDGGKGTVEMHITRIGDDPEKIAKAVAPVLKGIIDG